MKVYHSISTICCCLITANREHHKFPDRHLIYCPHFITSCIAQPSGEQPLLYVTELHCCDVVYILNLFSGLSCKMEFYLNYTSLKNKGYQTNLLTNSFINYRVVLMWSVTFSWLSGMENPKLLSKTNFLQFFPSKT